MGSAQPLGPWVSPGGAFNVLILSEGFTGTQEPDFLTACVQLRESVLATTPFGLARRDATNLAFWHYFTPSNSSGPAIGTAPGDTVYRSTYDPAAQTLAIDETALTSVVDSPDMLTLPAPNGGDSYPCLYLLKRPIRPNPGLVVILTPAISVGGVPVLAELEKIDPVNLSYVVLALGPRWHRVVLRGIGSGIGLGDEYANPDPAWATADDNAALGASFFPNLLGTATPPSGVPTPDFKWYEELDAKQRSQPLIVVPYGSTSPQPSEPIQLVEGGDGYQQHIYRSSPDCLMARKIGGGAASSPRSDDVPFCLICRHHIQEYLTGTTSRQERRTIHRQILEFDHVSTWNAIEKIASGFPLTRSAVGATTVPGPWWEYDATVDPANGGLQIRNLKFRGHSGASAGETVAELIEFRDIVVEFDGTERVPFDIAAAFGASNPAPVFLNATDGTADGLSTNYLRGLKLTLQDTCGGRGKVEVAMSLVLKGEAADADPGAQIYSAKFYPQVSLRWLSGMRTVTAFRACVRLVFNNALKPGTGMGGTGTVASFFVDTSNPGATVDRRIETYSGIHWTGVPPGLGWSTLFDYNRPSITQDTEILGVYGPKAARPTYRAFRKESYVWPPASTYKVNLWKLPDQGQYDNVHIHASMGIDPDDPNRGPMVHAPGCAEACIHLHWRWGVLAPAFPTPRFRSFLGWTNAGSNGGIGLPLIPINQDLKVAVTRPDTMRANPDSDVVVASQPFDLAEARKALWYTVDISDEVPPGEWQVLMEPGIAYAYKYNLSYGQPLLLLTLKYMRAVNPGLAGQPDDMVIHKMYSLLRWFYDAGGNVQQIPTGDLTPAAGGSSMENL